MNSSPQVYSHDQVNASSITKITSWLKFLGKNLHIETSFKVRSLMLSVSVKGVWRTVGRFSVLFDLTKVLPIKGLQSNQCKLGLGDLGPLNGNFFNSSYSLLFNGMIDLGLDILKIQIWKIKHNWYKVQVNLFQKLTTSWEHVVYRDCSECHDKNKTFL